MTQTILQATDLLLLVRLGVLVAVVVSTTTASIFLTMAICMFIVSRCGDLVEFFERRWLPGLHAFHRRRRRRQARDYNMTPTDADEMANIRALSHKPEESNSANLCLTDRVDHNEATNSTGHAVDGTGTATAPLERKLKRPSR